MDLADYEERKVVENRPRLIANLIQKGSGQWSTKFFDAKSLPPCTEEFCRAKSTSSFSIVNAKKYVHHLHSKSSTIKLQGHSQHSNETKRRDSTKRINKDLSPGQKMCENWRIVRIRGMPSKYTKNVGRTPIVLFDVDSGDVIDKWCNCKGGRKPYGCSHTIALLHLIGEAQGHIDSSKTSISEKLFKSSIEIPNPSFGGCSSGSSSSNSFQ